MSKSTSKKTKVNAIDVTGLDEFFKEAQKNMIAQMKDARVAELEQRLADAKARIEDITIKFSEAMGELNKSNSEDALWDLFNDIKHIRR